MPDRSDLAARLSTPAGIAGAGALLLPALLALCLPSALDGADSVNFALGLSDFDPALEQPHFPGYPVYIALCRLLIEAGLPETLALALPGVLASAALVPAQTAIGRCFGLSTSVLAVSAAFLLAQPLLWLEGPRPMPDLLACSLVWLALALAASARPAAGGLVLGLALGIRVDLAPLVVVAVALSPHSRARFALGLASGVAAWLPAFALALPPDGLARAARFAAGHFSVWGSTALAGAGRGDAIRGAALGLAAPVLPLLALLGVSRAPAGLRRFLACALGPYALWVLIGQNLASARHFLPFAPALALLGASGVASLPRGVLRSGSCAALAVSALVVLTIARPQHPDGRALSRRVFEVCADCTAIFGGPSLRLLEHYAPAGAPLYRRATLAEVRRDLLAWPMLDGAIGVTSELSGRAALGGPGEDVAEGLRLYRIDASALRYAP